jgi:hypothetical protein
MLKLLRVRSLLALLALSLVGAGIFATQNRLTSWWAGGRSWWHAAQEDGDWRQQELSFLKGIYDRLERQRQAEGGDASASLRREQETILRRLAETAKPIREKVSPEILALLSDAPVAEPEKPPQAEANAEAGAGVAVTPAPPASSAPPPLPEVRVELGSGPKIDAGLNPSSRYIEIDRPIEQIVKVREPRPVKSGERKSGEAKPSEGKAREANAAEPKPDEPKAETKTADSKAAKPKPAKPKPAAAAPETGGGAKE